MVNENNSKAFEGLQWNKIIDHIPFETTKTLKNA